MKTNILPEYNVLEYCSPGKEAQMVEKRDNDGYRLVGSYEQSDFERFATLPDFIAQGPKGQRVLLFQKKTSIQPPDFTGILELNRPIAFFDLETTGLDPNKDRIIEIAILKIGTEAIDTVSYLVKPPEPVSEEVTSITGITNEMLEDAPEWPRIAKDIQGFLFGCDLAGHNIEDFDVPFLKAEFDRVALEYPWPNNVTIIDTLQIARRQFRHDLSTMFKVYVKGSSDESIRKGNHFTPHRALDDVLASAAVFRQQLNHEKLGGDLASLREYFQYPYVDHQRKLKYNEDGKVEIAFGKKHNGKLLFNVMAQDMGYIDWMMSEMEHLKPFLSDMKAKYQAYISGQ